MKMLKLREAQMICNNIEFTYKKTINAVKWNEIYQSEIDIINDLKFIHIPSNKEMVAFHTLYKGYEYIHSFAKQVQSDKILSEKQIMQCKRLALEIKKAYEIRNCYIEG